VTVSVRNATSGDVEAVVATHLRAFDGFFLTMLGPRFLRRLYSAFLREPTGILVVGEDDSVVRGFVAGTTQPKGFFRRLLARQGAGFALSAVPALLRSPRRVARRLLAAVTYRGEAPAALPEAALLSSIAVDPDFSGRGLAGSLLQGFIEEARQKGCRAIYLTTDRDDNSQVRSFYERNGFRAADLILRDGGRSMVRYVRECGDQAEPG
jgi:ribosomal protein S18 acetylase RimI-like enzyme